MTPAKDRDRGPLLAFGGKNNTYKINMSLEYLALARCRGFVSQKRTSPFETPLHHPGQPVIYPG